MVEPTYAEAAQSERKAAEQHEAGGLRAEDGVEDGGDGLGRPGRAELAERVQQRVDRVGRESDEAEQGDDDDERREQREHRVVGEGGGELGRSCESTVPTSASTSCHDSRRRPCLPPSTRPPRAAASSLPQPFASAGRAVAPDTR